MSKPADTEAPRVLGIELRPVRNDGWIHEFGPTTVRITSSIAEGGFVGWVANKYLTLPTTIPDCIAAIERELLAIRNAIPEAPPSGNPLDTCLCGALRREHMFFGGDIRHAFGLAVLAAIPAPTGEASQGEG